jgi:archaemetzincin
MNRGFLPFLLLLALAGAGCRQAADQPSTQGPEVERLRTAKETVRPLYPLMGPVMFGDWLSFYPEKGQTFSQYLASRPNVPEGRRRILYVRPLGSFTPAQTRIVELTAEYLEQFYGLPARVAPALDVTGVPAGSFRLNKVTGTEQIQTGYLLDLLKDYLPDDAFAEIGLTATDLYPDEKMNFVFGQATLRDRVGVWSLHWLGEPDKSRKEFEETLVWTLKIASHETGHMFSIPHCAKYQCLRGRPSPARHLPGVHGQDLLGHPERSAAALRAAGRLLRPPGADRGPAELRTAAQGIGRFRFPHRSLGLTACHPWCIPTELSFFVQVHLCLGPNFSRRGIEKCARERCGKRQLSRYCGLPSLPSRTGE